MTQKKKNKGGRPLVLLTDEQIKKVESLAGRLNCVQIADYFGISHDTFTLIKRRQPEVLRAYKKGKSDLLEWATSKLVEKMAEGDAASIFFYIKTQGRWSEKHNNNRKISLNFSKEKAPLEIIDTALESLEKGKITPQEASQIGGLANLKANIKAGMPSEENTNVREGREELKKLLAGLDRLEDERKLQEVK